MKLHLLFLAAALAFGAGCLTDVGAPTPATNATTSPTSGANQTAAPPMAVTVTVGEGPTQDVPPRLYTISPAKLELRVGVPVNLTLKNAGQNSHDLIIEGIDGAKVPSIPGGQSASVEFTPTEAGEYEMYCTIGDGTPLSHRDNGMAGTVTVS